MTCETSRLTFTYFLYFYMELIKASNIIWKAMNLKLNSVQWKPSCTLSPPHHHQYHPPSPPPSSEEMQQRNYIYSKFISLPSLNPAASQAPYNNQLHWFTEYNIHFATSTIHPSNPTMGKYISGNCWQHGNKVFICSCFQFQFNNPCKQAADNQLMQTLKNGKIFLFISGVILIVAFFCLIFFFPHHLI